MMRSPSNWAVAVRKPDGQIARGRHSDISSPMARNRIFRLPVIRGVIALGESLAIGFRALAISANYAAQDPDAEEGEVADRDLARPDHLLVRDRDRVRADALQGDARADHDWLPIDTHGHLRDHRGRDPRRDLPRSISLLISLLPDLRRVFQYHAAEHKAINAYEAGEELTPENVQKFSLIHPRCGTAFLLWVMVIGIFVFAFVGQPAWYWLIVSRILLLPVIAGLAYELIRFAGKHQDNRDPDDAARARPLAPAADDATAVARPDRSLDPCAPGGAPP